MWIVESSSEEGRMLGANRDKSSFFFGVAPIPHVSIGVKVPADRFGLVLSKAILNFLSST
jgi:hypothetical protein